VNIDAILGQPSRFVYCTRYTGLTDELSRLTNDTDTKVVVISCLTGIVVNLTTTSDVPAAIEKAMGTLGMVIKDVVRNSSRIKLYISRCTTRNIQNFDEYASMSLVRHRN
jgi:hypothetical protein